MFSAPARVTSLHCAARFGPDAYQTVASVKTGSILGCNVPPGVRDSFDIHPGCLEAARRHGHTLGAPDPGAAGERGAPARRRRGDRGLGRERAERLQIGQLEQRDPGQRPFDHTRARK